MKINQEKMQELFVWGGKVTSSAAMASHAFFTIVDGLQHKWQDASKDGVVAALQFTAFVATIGLEEMCRRGSSGGDDNDPDGPNSQGGI